MNRKSLRCPGSIAFRRPSSINHTGEEKIQLGKSPISTGKKEMYAVQHSMTASEGKLSQDLKSHPSLRPDHTA